MVSVCVRGGLVVVPRGDQAALPQLIQKYPAKRVFFTFLPGNAFFISAFIFSLGDKQMCCPSPPLALTDRHARVLHLWTSTTCGLRLVNLSGFWSPK